MAPNKEKDYVKTQKNTGEKKKSSSGLRRRLKIGKNLSFAASEAYKLLRTNLVFSMADEEGCKVIGVTSALRGEGKSTTSMNLAYSLAESGKKTVLVEGDMRIPVVAKTLALADPGPGLSNVLAGIAPLEKAVLPSGLIDNLFVIPAGEIPPNPSELLSSARMEKTVEALTKTYDYIIIDLPPVNAVSDALAISGILSGMIMVVRQNYCDNGALSQAMRQLEFMNVKLLGFVMNYSEPRKSRYKKYGYKYRYGGYNYGYNYNYSDYYARRNGDYRTGEHHHSEPHGERRGDGRNEAGRPADNNR